MKVDQKVIVVTGAGNGIGRELALSLLSRGASIAALDIRETGLKETIHMAGDKQDRIAAFVVDITDKKAVEALPEKIIARFGAVDGVVNNAGIIQPFTRLKNLAYDDIERVMQVNLNGTLYMVKAFLPYLLQRPQAHIVNISSMGGFLPVPGQTVYGASKAAVKLMTEGLYAELLGTNVRVTVVYPGAIGTNISVNSGVATPEAALESSKTSKIKMLPPAEAARIIVDAIEKDRYSVLVGPDAKMMDFLYRLSPKMAAGMIYKQMKSLLPS